MTKAGLRTRIVSSLPKGLKVSTYKLIAALLLVSCGSLHAEEDLFRKGQFFIDLGYAAGQPRGEELDYLTDSTAYQLDSYRLLLLSTNQQKQLLGALRLATYSEPNKSAQSGRLGFEYAVVNWLGVGGSLNTEKIRLKGIYTGPIFDITYYLLPIFGTSCDGFFNATASCNPGILDYIASTKYDLKSTPLNTLDFDVGFHPGTGAWDPYFRLTMGAGKWDKATVAKGGTSLGCRYRVASFAYVFAEGYYNYYSIHLSASDSSSGTGGSATIQEGGGRAGFGFTF